MGEEREGGRERGCEQSSGSYLAFKTTHPPLPQPTLVTCPQVCLLEASTFPWNSSTGYHFDI